MELRENTYSALQAFFHHEFDEDWYEDACKKFGLQKRYFGIVNAGMSYTKESIKRAVVLTIKKIAMRHQQHLSFLDQVMSEANSLLRDSESENNLTLIREFLNKECDVNYWFETMDELVWFLTNIKNACASVINSHTEGHEKSVEP